MKNKASLLLLFLSLFFMSFIGHKYYISLTTIDINQQDKVLEISIKIFTEDLLTTIKIPAGTKFSDKKNETAFLNYVKDKFTVQVDGKKLPTVLVGIENDTDLTWLYLQVENSTPKGKIEIKNTILTETFSDQINMIYLNLGSTTFSEVTDIDNPSKSFYLQ